MVVNHLDKLIVTSDASTIVSELEVEHPAAKLLALAAKAQEQEIGDATNLVCPLPILSPRLRQYVARTVDSDSKLPAQAYSEQKAKSASQSAG